MSSYISLLLKKHPKKTLSFLLGLMLGSIHKIWPWQNKFNYNDFCNVIKKNINFSKIEIHNVDDEESSEDEISDDEYLD